MLVLGECFPLLIGVAPMRYDASTIRQLTDSFEGYFQKRERYAFMSVQPRGSIPPGPAERKLLMQWLSSERVRRCSADLCVGSAAVVDNTVMRGALTALLWFWQPPFPLEVVKAPEQGIAHCIELLQKRGLVQPDGAATLSASAARALAAALDSQHRTAQR